MTSTDATAAGQGRAGVWNLPNVLTMIRIALVPFFVWFLLADAPGLQSEAGPWRWAAVLAFAVAIYTDKLDGDPTDHVTPIEAERGQSGGKPLTTA